MWIDNLVLKLNFIFVVKKLIIELLSLFLLFKVFRFICKIVIFVNVVGGGNIVIILVIKR